MANKKLHTIVIGVIIAVIGGFILSLIEPAKNLFLSLLSTFWNSVLWMWEALFSSYGLPGWALLILSFLALFPLFDVFQLIMKKNSQPHFEYVRDYLHKVNWEWRWFGDQILDLWCYCPSCSGVLIFNDSDRGPYGVGDAKTHFICEHCDHQTKSTIPGVESQALGLIEREIHRKVKTKEYKALLETRAALETNSNNR